MKPYDDSEDKGGQVKRMFDAIAPRYDLLNHLMTLGIDKLWRRKLARRVRREAPLKVLDLATGTGDMAVLLARTLPLVHVTGADPSPGMLAGAQKKVEKKGLQKRVALIEVSAEALPFDEGSFDAATAVFGVRNFSDIPSGLAQMTRVVKRGGAVYVLEFAVPRNKIFGYLYHGYFHRIVPALGGWISGDRRAYDYLPRSVDGFPPREEFLGAMQKAGLRECSADGVFFGIANIYKGVKI